MCGETAMNDREEILAIIRKNKEIERCACNGDDDICGDCPTCLAQDLLNWHKSILSNYIRKEEYNKVFEENRALEKDKKDLMAHLDSLEEQP